MDTVLIVMGVLLVVVLGYGIYRGSTRHLRERASLKPNSQVNRQNGVASFIIIAVAIALLVGLFMAYSYFTSL